MPTVIRTLGPEDVVLVCAAAAGVFDNAPQTNLTIEFLNDPRHHLVASIDEGQLIGFVSAVHYVHPDKPMELFINEVAVAPAHQNRGIARQMLQTMLALARDLGCRCAWVLTENANAPAMHLYAAVGAAATPASCVLFEFPLESETAAETPS